MVVGGRCSEDSSAKMRSPVEDFDGGYEHCRGGREVVDQKVGFCSEKMLKLMVFYWQLLEKQRL